MLLIVLFSICCLSFTPRELNIYWVSFSDKEGTPYSIFHPEDYLSSLAIEKRIQRGIPIDETDLPISPAYIDSILAFGGEIQVQSKWINGVAVKGTSVQMAMIGNLNFVTSVIPCSYAINRKPSTGGHRGVDAKALGKYGRSDSEYGFAGPQISMMYGHYLHALGYKGQGIQVGVFDGGFSSVDVSPFFHSLRKEGRLMEGIDIVEKDGYVYEASSHGTKVLSTMAADLPGLMVGTGPKANYRCIITEDVQNETPLEEYNWIAGLEKADSVGIDMINSSLGYTVFRAKELNHTYEQLDGFTWGASRAATLAAKKGMLIVCSAGNEGNGKWKYISVPADAYDILSIGALKGNGERARFSSIGPSYDGRIKPELVGMGEMVATCSLNGYEAEFGNGTSYASPIVAGAIASLWSANPEKSNYEIMDLVKQSSSNYEKPNNKIGFGLPNFLMALSKLKECPIVFKNQNLIVQSEETNSIFYAENEFTGVMKIRNELGTLIDFKVVSLVGEYGLVEIPLDIKSLNVSGSILIELVSRRSVNKILIFRK